MAKLFSVSMSLGILETMAQPLLFSIIVTYQRNKKSEGL